MRSVRMAGTCVTMIFMKRILCFFVAVFIGSPTQAQQTQKKVPIERIAYTRSIPAAVRKQMPHGATSCFYGSFKLSARSPRFLLHLFNPNPKQAAQPMGNGEKAKCHFTLHIFESGKATSGARQKLRLINSGPVQYSSMVEKPIRFGAHLLWLDYNRRNKPILKFDCFDPNGFSGLIGDEVIVVFPTGLKGRAAIQSFAYGAWSGSDSAGAANTFDDIDEDGLLQIRHYTFIRTSEIPQPPPALLRWSGEKFAPVKGKDIDIQEGK